MSIKCFYNKGANFCFAITILLVLFMGSEVRAQGNTTVTGIVLDESGLSIPAVSISEKGTDNSVITDLDGKFTIKVAGQKSELVFSYLGFETVTQVVGKQKEISVVLKSADSKLDEVVIIGYGTARKSDLTGSVSTISGDDLKKTTMSNVAETLTGRIAGVKVTSSEGGPDADINIRIRGGGSLTQDGSPLLIVDGFPVNSISDISPSDIDKLTILKDASSTAIYGSRGANGVIIITTKSGTKGERMSISYNSFYGAKFLANTVKTLNPQEYANWQYEYALLKGDQDSYDSVFGPYQPDQFAGVAGTNWQREIYGRMGTVQNHDLGIRGGSDKLNYSFNYTRYNEDAIMIGSDFKRDNLSLNLKNKINDKLSVSMTMRYSETTINGGGANEQKEFSSTDSRLKHVVGYAPIPLPGITSDDPDESLAGYLVNPFTATADNNRLQKRRNVNLLGGITWKTFKNFQIKSDFGLDNYNYADFRFYGRSTYYVVNVPSALNQGMPALIINNRQDNRFRNANTITYDFKDVIGENHNLNVLAGQELISYRTTNVASVMHAFPKLFSFEDSMNLTASGKPQTVDTFVYPEDRLLSFFGRVNYDYKNKYLFTATYRADGSSKFLGDNRWGYFPSAAVAWKMSSENFLKDVSWIDLIKMRLSYGEAGNNNIPTGQTVQTFMAGNSAWINGVGNYLSATKIMANPNLKWETTVTQNVGLDYEFFKGRISGSLEAYKNVTKDLLVMFPIFGGGYDAQYQNIGEIQNTGVEASLNLVAIDKKDYGLNFNFNIAFNKNRINSLGVLNNFFQPTGWSSVIGADYLVEVGQPLGIMRGYQSDGRYEVSDFDFANGVYTLKAGVADATSLIGNLAPGMMKLKDINGDGIVDVNDISAIGNANPKHTGGVVINANAYGFDLSAAFNWSFGNDIYNANKVEFNTAVSNNGNGQYRNLSTLMTDGNRWTNVDGSGQLITDPTQLAAANENTTMWSPYMSRYIFSDWAVEDGSFLRLNTLTLGYTLPDTFVTKMRISKLRFYATVNNVFVLTNYSGLDPEVSTRRATPLTPGVDYSAYPRNRQFVFGLNLNF